MKDLKKVLDILSLTDNLNNIRLKAIYNLIIPPLELGQYIFYEDKEVPLCWASWALLSDEVSKLYAEQKYNLKAEDWNSGNNLWLVNIICPYGGGSIALRRLDKIREERDLPKVVNFRRLGTGRTSNVQRI
tara:strand:+ start:1717 stop:2109 length:393 start_codon:yes stop_codon:yes gene_type:complete